MKINEFRHQNAPVSFQPHPPKWGDLIGIRIGRLVVLGYTGRKNKFDQKLVTCRCDCGFFLDVKPGSLRAKNTTSCGCAFSEAVASKNVRDAKHGDARGGEITPIYRVWFHIKQHCFNPKHKAYRDYGARGISVHGPWINDYARFRADVVREIGEKPGRQFSIDRIDNNGNYEPGNIRWATMKEQNANRRVTVRYELNGESKMLPEWAEQYQIEVDLVRQRIRKFGWSLEEALRIRPGESRSCEEDLLRGVRYQMIQRCHDPSHPRFKDYGGRGIAVCSEWRASFEQFLADVGARPSPQHSLDRIDNDRGYVPGNVCWRTFLEQNRNRRNTQWYELYGQRRTMAEWSALAGIPYSLVRNRVLTYKWPIDEALGTPAGAGRGRKEDRIKWTPP